MNAIIHEPHRKPFLAWIDNRPFLTDPQRQKVLCEFKIRTNHNGRELPSPEIALPEVYETQVVADTGFLEFKLPIHQHRVDSE